MRLSIEGFKVLRDLSGKLTHREKIVYGVGAATVVAVGAAIIAVATIVKVNRDIARAYQSDDDWTLGI
jgi:cell division protein FtsL